MRRLPRNLHFEARKVLCLPRNLHFALAKCCACHAICTSRVTKCCACHEIWTSRFTKCCTCHEICKQTSHVSKSHDSLHLSRNQSTSKITTMSKVLHLPRNLHLKYNRSDPLHLSRKLDFGAPKHEVSLAPATQKDHHVRKCAQHHNESAVATSTRRRHPDFASLRSRNACRRFREA